MPPNLQIPKELAELLAATPDVTAADLQRLKIAGEALENDAQHQADLQKGYFVNAITNALEEEGSTKAELAKKLKVSRQYLSQLLDDEEPANFTVDTLSAVAAAANRKLVMLVLKGNETAHIMRCIPEMPTAAVVIEGESDFKLVSELKSQSVTEKTNFHSSLLCDLGFRQAGKSHSRVDVKQWAA